MKYSLKINNVNYEVEVSNGNGTLYQNGEIILEDFPFKFGESKVISDQQTLWMDGEYFNYEMKSIALKEGNDDVGGNSGLIVSPITGIVIEVNVKEKQKIKCGDILCRIEAMKMIYTVNATKDGVIKRICVKRQGQVSQNALLAEIQ